MKQRLIVCFCSFLIFLTACTTATSELPTQKEPTLTSIPTQEPAIEFVIIFDGNNCVAEGPSEVLPGEYGFKFIDKSGVDGELWILYLNEGKTFQNVLEVQSEPGEWYPKPSWIQYGLKIHDTFEVVGESKVQISIWDLKWVKQYLIMCYINSPKKAWFVHPFYVVETLSN